jgi:transcription-repair coupling factor (superfamily II helicase)
MDIGIERLVLKNDKLICYFVSNQQSPYYQSEAFTQVLKFVQANSRTARMKETNNKLTLTFDPIKSIANALIALKPMTEVVAVI